MSTEMTARPELPAAHTGTVFDIGYRRYLGRREGRNRARLAVYKNGLRTALALGRGGRAKILPWFFIVVIGGIGFIMALMVGAAERMGGPGAAEQLDLPSHSDLYGIAAIVLFVFAAVVGPELLCRDRREGTINLYLVRPLTGSDYIAARWLAFLTVMVATAWLPQIILLIGLSMGAPDTVEYFRENWRDIPRLLASGAVIGAYITSLALLTASFTTRRAYASVFLVGLFVVSTPFTVGLASELDGAAGHWVSMFNLTNIPVHVNDIIFNEVSEITEDAPARELSREILVGWYALWTVLSTALLWNRYRRMSP